NLTGRAAGATPSAKFRVRRELDAALPARDEAVFAIARASAHRAHFVAVASDAAGAAVSGVGLGVDTGAVTRGAAARALAAALDAAGPAATARVARAAMSGVARRVRAATGARLGPARATAGAGDAAFTRRAADAAGPAVGDIAREVGALSVAGHEPAATGASALDAGVTRSAGVETRAAVGWIRQQGCAGLAAERFVRAAGVYSAGASRRGARCSGPGGSAEPGRGARARRCGSAGRACARPGDAGVRPARVAARRGLRGTSRRGADQGEPEEDSGDRKRIHRKASTLTRNRTVTVSRDEAAGRRRMRTRANQRGFCYHETSDAAAAPRISSGATLSRTQERASAGRRSR